MKGWKSMSRRLNKLRRDLEKRRRQINIHVKQKEYNKAPLFMSRHEEAREDPEFYLQHDGSKQDGHMLQQKEFFLARTLIALCLFLVIGILFKTNVPQFERVRDFVLTTYEQEFQFASIAHWYENQFGRPLALIPAKEEPPREEDVEMVYALPTNGVIHEDFEKNGKGILIETAPKADIEAIRGGYVISVGEDKESDLGKTVVVQHYDGTESVYGMLSEIKVNVYDHIQAGTKIGTVAVDEQGEKGIFYLALKQNNHYINPSDVLPFE